MAFLIGKTVEYGKSMVGAARILAIENLLPDLTMETDADDDDGGGGGGGVEVVDPFPPLDLHVSIDDFDSIGIVVLCEVESGGELSEDEEPTGSKVVTVELTEPTLSDANTSLSDE